MLIPRVSRYHIAEAHPLLLYVSLQLDNQVFLKPYPDFVEIHLEPNFLNKKYLKKGWFYTNNGRTCAQIPSAASEGTKESYGQIIRVDMETLEYVQTMSYCRPTCVYL